MFIRMHGKMPIVRFYRSTYSVVGNCKHGDSSSYFSLQNVSESEYLVKHIVYSLVYQPEGDLFMLLNVPELTRY